MSHQELNCSSQFQIIQTSSNLNFAPTKIHNLSQYEFKIDAGKTVQCEELQLEKGENGEYQAARYSSGAFVRRLALYTIVKGHNQSLWLGDRFGGWHPLD